MKRIIMIIMTVLLLTGAHAYAQEASLTEIDKQRIELNRKEEIIQKEMERLQILKNEVNNSITEYTRLLKEIEKSLEQAEAIGSKRLRHVAKAYEAMPPEDAAKRLSGLDNTTAVRILLKMKSKKAGLVIGMMETRKATNLTKEIAKLKK